MNQDAWAKLPKAYQEVFAAASTEAAAAMQQRYDAKNPAAFERLRASDVALRPYSDEIMTGAREAATQLYADQARQDGTYRDLYEHWQAFRKASVAWFGTSELAYARFQFG